jgi:hypothetical protein
MSKNYYWREGVVEVEDLTDKDNPELHVGLSVWRGEKFIWAQPPADVQVECEQHPDRELIEDEYGQLYTGAEFLDVLQRVKINDVSSVGTRLF